MGIKGKKARKKLDVRIGRYDVAGKNPAGMKYHKPGSLNSKKG